MRMLDLFCGRWGWSRAFAARGWECVGVDLSDPPTIPPMCAFEKCDVLTLDADFCRGFDFICASSPCEQFSIHGMKHFHPKPKYPELGIKLFEHTRAICETSGVPYVMENVRAAQQFVGRATHRCGPFYLWGSGVPVLMIQGRFKKGMRFMPGNVYKGRGFDQLPIEQRRHVRTSYQTAKVNADGGKRSSVTARTATIPPEIASCVAEYAERLLELETSTLVAGQATRNSPAQSPCFVDEKVNL